MKEERSSDLPPFGLLKVEGPSLDPQKNWYVLSKVIVSSSSGQLVDFANQISKIFPDKIKNVATWEIHPVKSEGIAAYKNYTRCPTNLYVVSTFGLCVGLLRQRDIPPGGLLSSPAFRSMSIPSIWSYRRRRMKILA